MTDSDVKRLAAVLSVQAKIDGMKARLQLDKVQGEYPSWSYQDFERESENLKMLATCRDDQLQEAIQSLC